MEGTIARGRSQSIPPLFVRVRRLVLSVKMVRIDAPKVPYFNPEKGLDKPMTAAGGTRHTQTWTGSVGKSRSAISSTFVAPTQSPSGCQPESVALGVPVRLSHRLKLECPARTVASASGPPVCSSALFARNCMIKYSISLYF